MPALPLLPSEVPLLLLHLLLFMKERLFDEAAAFFASLTTSPWGHCGLRLLADRRLLHLERTSIIRRNLVSCTACARD